MAAVEDSSTLNDDAHAPPSAEAASACLTEDGAFSSLCRMATARLGLAAAVIGLRGPEGWQPLAMAGLDHAGAVQALDLARAMRAGEPALVVRDARRHPRFADHAATLDAAGVRFVASLPLTTSAGDLIGRLCVLDTRARRVTRAVRETLADLARLGAALVGQRLLTTRLEREIAERQDSEQALRVVGARLRAAVDSLPFQFWMVDGQGRCIMQNREDERVWGKIVGQHIYDPVADMEQNQEWRQRLTRAFAGETVSFEMRYDREGGRRDFQEIIAPVDLDDELIGLVGLGIDITARRQAEAALVQAAERTSLALSAGRMGTWEWAIAEDRLSWDATQCRLFGVGPETAPTTVGEFMALVHPDDRPKLERATRGTEPYEDEFRIVHADGTTRWIAERGVVTSDLHGQPRHLIGVNYDVTDRRAAEARIRELADTDALTGLANRRSFLLALERELSGLRHGELGAVLLLDLDHFKEINDTLGHDAGDTLLQGVAQRLVAQRRPTDIVARLGGDEFAVILTRLHVAEEVRAISEAILAGFTPTFRHEGHELHIRVSIGVSLFPNDGQDAAVLLKNADIALYQAKGQGRGTSMFFDPGLRLELERKRLVGEALRQGLARDQIELVFQPQVSLANGRHLGFEALVRWRRDGVLLPPGTFLPIAEETGLATSIGRMVALKACEQMRAWLDQGLEPGRMAVNIAATQLKVGDLAGELAGLLASHALEPTRLEIEITENVFLESGQERIAAVLRAVDQLGISIALDDFGTGYASLTHLKRFPVDRLKIDRSFVRDLETDAGDAAIVLSIISLAHALSLEVVAEGIEADTQRAFLANAGCDIGQGFLFGPGLGTEAATRYLRREQERGSAPDAAPGQPRLIMFRPRQGTGVRPARTAERF